MIGVIFPFRTIGPVPVDVVVEESLEASMEIPEHPVERGAKLTDHAYRKPTKLKMTVWTKEAMPTWQVLYALMKQAEPFAIVTGFDLFDSMLIESIEPKRDAETSTILAFDCTLKEIMVVSSQESSGKGAEAGNQGTGGDERGQAKTERGEVQAREVNTSSGRGEAVLNELEAV